MRIINIEDKQATSYRLQATRKAVPYVFALAVATLACAGCARKNEVTDAKQYAQESERYYQKAVSEYRMRIKKAKNAEPLYLELGKLYFDRGNFQQALDAFKKCNLADAKKGIALSLYRLGNFTDALEAFTTNEALQDDEFVYYHGMTCEKLNLYDQAIVLYKRIRDPRFLGLASVRLETIEKYARGLQINDVSPQAHAIISAAPPAEQFPQAGALVLLCEEAIVVTSANTEISSSHYLIKILNERGKEGFSETQISYDSTYEKVELEFARTIKPDGTVIEVGSRHIRDVSRYLNFPLYSNARVLIISFPEIVEGATIEYKVKIYRSQLVNKKDFIVTYPVQASEPIIAASFALEVPKEREIHLKVVNERFNTFGAALKPQVSESPSTRIYRWNFAGIPQIIPEPRMPPETEINPTLFISTFSSWKEVYAWWWALAKDKIQADAAIKEKVKELIKGRTSEIEKAKAVYNFCAQKIRYVAVEYGQAGYEPHSAADIFRNKYGDCKDQAVLLVTMLREAGLPAWPVLIPTKDAYKVSEDFPSLHFDHSIAALLLQDAVIFLDPTASTCVFGDLPPADQERTVFICKEDGFLLKDTPLYPASHNYALQKLTLQVSSLETITGEKSVNVLGAYEQMQRYWLLYTLPELIRQTLKEKIQEISIGAVLGEYAIENADDLNKPVELRYTFSGPEYWTAAGNLRILPQLASIDTSLVAKDARVYELDFGILDSKESVIEIEIPKSFMIQYMPESVSVDSPWLKVEVTYRIEGKRLYCRQKNELKKTSITQEEYPVFKNFLESLAKKIKQRVVLAKEK